MRVITVMNLKGGSTKSTTVVHAAVESVRRGLKVLVVDTDDPQHSSAKWSQARTDDSPVVITAPASKLQGVLDKAREQGFDLVIVDTPPKMGPMAIDAVKLSDRVVVPVKPDPFDVSAVMETIDILKRHEADSLIFLTCCPHGAPEVEQTRALMESTGLPMAKTSIGYRRAFTRSVLTGRSVAEFEPKGKAAAEMSALMDEVLK